MTKLKPNILTSIALLLMGWVAVSCSSESMPEPEKPTGDVPMVGISIGVSGPTRSSNPGDFELGEELERFLNIDADDYRIYFFSADNKYIGTFKPTIKPVYGGHEVYPDDNGYDTHYYTFWGQAPDNLPASFKLVFLANWGNENYPEESGEGASNSSRLVLNDNTTILDLTTHQSSQFNHLANPGDGEWLNKTDRLIPFYGVRAYDLSNTDYADGDGKLKKGSYIDLRTKELSLPIIRAMAKVEVILANPLASFSKVEMTRVNDKGFCAPYQSTNWNFDYTDYFHGYIWDTDFVRGVHLVNGVNEVATENGGRLSFKKVSDHSVGEDGKPIYEKWVAYVPEYHNQGDENFTAIEVTLAEPQNDQPSTTPDDSSGDKEEGSETTSKPWDNPTNKIYFAQNGNKPLNADKEIDNTKFFNIERNNIYRFTITGMSAGLKCEVDIQPYAGIDVDPFYGLDRDEEGNIIVERYPDGTYKVLDKGKHIIKDQDGDIITKRFGDKSLLCIESIYKDYIHDDSEIDYEYVYEKDAPGGNMIILRQKTNGGLYHSDNIPDHDHGNDDKALFILDKKGEYYYVHYDENNNVTELTRTDSKGDVIVQANGYQFRKDNEMTDFIGTYIVLLEDGTEELRHWQTGEKVDWATGIVTKRAMLSSPDASRMKQLNRIAVKRFINR